MLLKHDKILKLLRKINQCKLIDSQPEPNIRETQISTELRTLYYHVPDTSSGNDTEIINNLFN